MRPRSPDPHHSSHARADLEACRALLRNGSRTFHAASLVLPRRLRDAATALYAFCRVADDAIDLPGSDAAGLDQLRDRLARIYQGRPAEIPADRAFAEVVAQFAIPRSLPEALLEGFAWDQGRRRYASLEDLCDYAARVAGTVGAMMALLMGRRDPDVLARACDLGVAMQLTNIARDVGEDARAGRIYLPTRWFNEAGIDPDAWLANPVFSPSVGVSVARLLGFADELYQRAAGGIACLPRSCRPGMHAARLIYAEIGREVERQALDSVAQRAVVSGRRKASLVATAIIASIGSRRGVPAAPLPATRFLVESVAAMPLRAEHDSLAAPYPWWRFGYRVARIIDLFERLERREQFARAPGRS